MFRCSSEKQMFANTRIQTGLVNKKHKKKRTRGKRVLIAGCNGRSFFILYSQIVKTIDKDTKRGENVKGRRKKCRKRKKIIFHIFDYFVALVLLIIALIVVDVRSHNTLITWIQPSNKAKSNNEKRGERKKKI